MTESQRRPSPRNDGGELDTALAFLSFARESLLKKLDGVDERQARATLLPTRTTLLGLVKHSIDGERYWFGVHLIGLGREPDWDAAWTLDSDDTIESITSAYRAAIADSDAAIEQVEDMAALSVGQVDGAPKSLRWTMAHMTSETARHAGHADILRELTDGTTGR